MNPRRNEVFCGRGNSVGDEVEVEEYVDMTTGRENENIIELDEYSVDDISFDVKKEHVDQRDGTDNAMLVSEHERNESDNSSGVIEHERNRSDNAMHAMEDESNESDNAMHAMKHESNESDNAMHTMELRIACLEKENAELIHQVIKLQEETKWQKKQTHLQTLERKLLRKTAEQAIWWANDMKSKYCGCNTK